MSRAVVCLGGACWRGAAGVGWGWRRWGYINCGDPWLECYFE